ncbi:MAG: ATP-binding cassette domain-containing protein [Sediminibacterium sp.]
MTSTTQTTYPMTSCSVSLNGAGKKFNREWIFREMNFHFEAGKSYAITGPNGSGKSTLLQCIAGSCLLSEGNLIFIDGKRNAISEDRIYQFISFAAPYLELIEEMTPLEFLRFHLRFKPLLPGTTLENILALAQLEAAANKQIRFFSSGMKQRLKLLQAFYSDVPVILLDEPCTNLDCTGFEFYKALCEGPGKNRLTIIGSNDPEETEHCVGHIHLPDYR